MHETGHSKTMHWYNPEGWDGEGGGKWVWDGGTPVNWFMLMYGKNHHNIVK